ncbi:MRL1 [Symbiodinium necroappetens]|uniref:MRL1 protein n=1 Tax=Symbiodinium necroappetens TaxID=1628268 RepID=A0A812TN70_9DINO|nr:MRL1 [Symbiodinium necroappetens]
MSSRPEAKANGRTRKKQRFYPLAPEPKAKRARPENPSLGLEALLAGPSCWTSDAAEALVAFGQMASLAIEEVPNLQEMWTALEAVGSSLSSDAGGAALRRLPDLLGAAAVDGASEGLRSHLEKGGAIEALPLPTRAQGNGGNGGNGSTSSEAFRWLHERVEAELDAAIQGKRDIPSLQWLATVAMFYGRLRPGPPLPRNVLEDSADLALRAVEKSPLEGTSMARAAKSRPLDAGQLLLRKIQSGQASTELLAGVAGALHGPTPILTGDKERTVLLRGLANVVQWQLAVSLLRSAQTQRLDSANVVHCNTVLSSCQKALWPVGHHLLHTAAEKKLRPDTISFNTLMASESWLWALRGLLQLANEGVAMDLISCNTSLSSCERCSRWKEAVHIFEENDSFSGGSLTFDIITFSTLISSWDKSGHWQQALHLLEDLPSRSLQLDLTALNAALGSSAWMVAVNLLQSSGQAALQTDEISCNSVTSCCEKSSRWIPALQLLRVAGGSLLRLAENGYHAAISACEKARRWEVSLDIAEILATSGLDRSIFASAATISACEKGKQWRKAFEVFALAAERLLELNAVAWSALVSSSEKIGHWMLAVSMLSEMFSTQLPPSCVTCNAAISACEGAMQWQLAVWGLRAIHILRLSPDVISWNAAASACEKRSAWSQVLKILTDLSGRGQTSDGITRSAATFACDRASRWQHVLDLAAEMARSQLELDVILHQARLRACLRTSSSPRPAKDLFDEIAATGISSLRDVMAEQLTKLSRVALGAALSGTLGCHPIYGRVASAAAAALDGGKAGTRLSSSTIHDVSLTLALLQPWSVETEEHVARFRSSVAKNVLPKSESAPAESEVVFLGGSSVAGLRNGEPKENQDTFHAHVDGSVATIAVVDGHGKRGQILSAAARDGIAKALAELKGGAGMSEELAEVIMTVDADLLIHEKAEVEAELSGATCAVLRVEGLGHAERRLALAHLGDCRAVLGRVRPTNGTGSPTWTTVRLTEDHRPGEAAEAARLVAAGGRVQKMPGPAGVDPAMLGPPRVHTFLLSIASELQIANGRIKIIPPAEWTHTMTQFGRTSSSDGFHLDAIVASYTDPKFPKRSQHS